IYPDSRACTGGTDQLVQQRIGEFVQFFRQHLQQDSYDIYHAQDCLSANALAQLKAENRIPHFVRTVHHIEAFTSPYLRDCQDKSIFQPDRCLCVSDLWQTVLRNEYGISAHRVINGVSDRFSPQSSGTESAIAQAYGLTGQPIFLTVGGIEPRKNSIALLQAFCQVHTHLPNAQLVIAGGATLFDYRDYREEFMALAQSLPEGALVLPGVVPDADLPALYRLADAFIFPSVQEGWGLVVLEAIASGVPVVTSNQPPFTEFLSDETALLVEPKVSQIATALQQVLDPTIAQRLVTNGPSLIQRYRWRTAAEMHLTLYHQLVMPP
ncbi:MAG: MSMEG_0565 family glycosyltransferase, partial [Cyanobacteria bacterium J06607_6]